MEASCLLRDGRYINIIKITFCLFSLTCSEILEIFKNRDFGGEIR